MDLGYGQEIIDRDIFIGRTDLDRGRAKHGGGHVRPLPFSTILIHTYSIHNINQLNGHNVLDRTSPSLYVPIILDGYNGGGGY